jgi:hypothetical protein
MRSVLAGFLLVFAFACPMALAAELTTSDGRAVRNVAVVSGIGDTVVLYHAEPSIPVTVYVSDVRMLVIPDFSIDARIERLIGSLLATRFNIVTRPTVRIDFGEWDARAIGEKIRGLPKREDVDAYVIACRDERAIESGAFLTFSGLGLYNRESLFREITDVFAAYRIVMVDARTGEIITGREAGIETGPFESALPRKRVANARWPGDDKPLPPDQIPILRDDLYELIDASVPWTLRELKLVP